MGRIGPHGEFLPDRRWINRMTAKFRKKRDANDDREAIHELVSDEFDDDMDDSFLLSGSITNSDSIPTLDVREMAETARCLKRESDESRASMRHAIEQMEPCGNCGRRVRYLDGPPEAIAVCRCVLGRLKAGAPPPESEPTPLPFPLPSLFGIRVEVYP